MASTYAISLPSPVLINATGDTSLGAILYDSEFLGGFIETSGDEGAADAVLTIEKWDDVTGTAQTAISAEVTCDAGAAEVEPIATLGTAASVVAAGYKLNMVIATAATNAITGKITLFFKTVDDLGEDG